jgi:hypothetical protein
VSVVALVPARNGVVALVSESALDSQPLPLHIRSMHYSFREGVVSPAVWAWWAHASEVLSDWYGRQLNVERKGASLAAATRATLVKVAAAFFGFGVLCLGRAPCLTLFLDGPLVQQYVRFLRSRGLARASIVKNLGHVRYPRVLGLSGFF